MASKHFAGAQEFIDRIENCAAPRDVVRDLAAYVRQYEFETVGLGHVLNPTRHVADTKQVFQLSNWDPQWIDVWFHGQMMMRDPIARFARTQEEWFYWRDAFDDQHAGNRIVENLMRDAGFRNGIAFPIRSGETRQLGIISLGAKKLKKIDDDVVGALDLACTHAYDRIEKLYGHFAYLAMPRLSPRQSDILHYAAGGKSNRDIATILGIKPTSVRDHILSAAKKLGTYGRTQTITVAMSLGLVLL